MFDIGFAELVIIGVISLLVIGPDRLPGAIRTASVWVGRLRRSFNDIKREVQQELHNDEVMQELRRTSEQVKREANELRRGFEEPASSDAASARTETTQETDDVPERTRAEAEPAEDTAARDEQKP
jgi:sec-independent protein translocase protein TatB